MFFCGTDGDMRRATTLLEHFYAWTDGAALETRATDAALAALDAELDVHRSMAQFKLGFNGCVAGESVVGESVIRLSQFE